MMKISIDVNATTLLKRLNISSSKHNKIVSYTLEKGAQESVNIARREAPIKTGNLRRTITPQKINDLSYGIKSGAKANNMPYWQFIQYGTRAHIITGDPLVFKNKQGKLVVTNKVMHPGTKPNPFVTRTLNQMKGKFMPLYHEALQYYGVI